MLIWLLARILWLYTFFVGISSRKIFFGREHEQNLYLRRLPFIYTFWHNRQSMLLYFHKNKPVSILISPSRDGEIISRMASCYGMSATRGSSRKSPTNALRGLVGEIRKGRCVAITPDGPLGPAQTVKHGVVYLAQALKIPILPLTESFARKIVLGSWDRFLVPFPFNRIVVGYREPFWVGENDDLAGKAEELKAVLNSLTLKADDMVRSL